MKLVVNKLIATQDKNQHEYSIHYNLREHL